MYEFYFCTIISGSNHKKKTQWHRQFPGVNSLWQVKVMSGWGSGCFPECLPNGFVLLTAAHFQVPQAGSWKLVKNYYSYMFCWAVCGVSERYSAGTLSKVFRYKSSQESSMNIQRLQVFVYWVYNLVSHSIHVVLFVFIQHTCCLFFFIQVSLLNGRMSCIIPAMLHQFIFCTFKVSR